MLNYYLLFVISEFSIFFIEIFKSLSFHTNSLQYEILKNPMGLIEFTLNKDEKVTAEAAAMVYIRGDIKTETKMRKGGSEIFFSNHSKPQHLVD